VLNTQEDRYLKRKEENTVKLAQLWELKKMQFEPAQRMHRTMLLRLWDVVFPHHAFNGLSSEEAAVLRDEAVDKDSLLSASWTFLGFQGKYPPSDFR
jgi:hypothetical protein